MYTKYLVICGLIIVGGYSVWVSIRSCWVASEGCVDLGIPLLPAQFIAGCAALGIAAYLCFRRP